MINAQIVLLEKLDEGFKSDIEEGWVSSEEVLKHFKNR